MAYLRAALLAVVVAIVLGAAIGVRESLKIAHDHGSTPNTKAMACAVGISTGLNCAAFFCLVLAPGAVAVLFVKRRLTKR